MINTDRQIRRSRGRGPLREAELAGKKELHPTRGVLEEGKTSGRSALEGALS